MSKRSTWVGGAITLFVVFSMALVNFATGVKADVPTAHAGKHAASKASKGSSPRCKTVNKPKGTLIFSDYQFPASNNWYTSGNNIATTEQTSVLQDGIDFYNYQAKLTPDMVSKIPSVKNGGISKNFKTYTFHLKPGIYWSNGMPITSTDFKFSWMVNMQKVTGPYCLQSCDDIASIDTPNASTVVYHLKKVEGPALTTVLSYFIWPHKWLGQYGWKSGDYKSAAKKLETNTYTFENPKYPYSGPFMTSQFVKDSRIVYVPNPYYRIMACGTSLKKFIFTVYTDQNALVAAAATHATDITTDYAQADLPLIKAHKSAYKYDDIAAFGLQLFTFNWDPTYNGSPNPVHNLKVRQALDLALDHYGVSAALNGSNSIGHKYIAWDLLTITKTVTAPFADKSIQGVYDPIKKKAVMPGTASAIADAKKLLAQTPFKNGFTLDGVTTAAPARAAGFNVALANWKKLGVTLNWKADPNIFNTYSTGGTLYHGKFQVSLHGFFGGSVDPDGWRGNWSYKFCARRPGNTPNDNEQNEACFNDPAMEKDWNTELHSADKKVRAAAFKDLQLRLWRNAYIIPITYYTQLSTWDSHVVNFHDNVIGNADWNAYEYKYKA